MKIVRVRNNNHRKAFEVVTRGRELAFPYVVADLPPTVEDPLDEVWVDEELGREGFTYRLASGHEGTVHIEDVLEYNRDPGHTAESVLHQLTAEAKKRVEESPLSTREIIRRLDTSATQFYRLLDPTNTKKSLKQLIVLLSILDCEVEVIVKQRESA